MPIKQAEVIQPTTDYWSDGHPNPTNKPVLQNLENRIA